MHCNTVPKTMFLGLLLTIVFLAFSASTSSCETGVNSYSTDYKTMAYNDAVSVGYPAQLFVNQIQWESGFDPNARGGDGEIGIAQFLPSTAAGLGINPYDPVDSLRGASQLMERYYVRYKYNISKALGAYNCGGGCMDGALAGCSAFWEQCIPPSTVRYINGIRGY